MRRSIKYRLEPMSALVNSKVSESSMREVKIRNALTDFYNASAEAQKDTFCAVMLVNTIIEKLEISPESIRQIFTEEWEKSILDPDYKPSPTKMVKEEGHYGFVRAIAPWLYNKYHEQIEEYLGFLIIEKEKCCVENAERRLS